jgi:excisionase family DNA binding protein
MTERPSDSPWLNIREAAERARVSPSYIEQAAMRGELRSRKLGRRRIFHVDWVDAWLEATAEEVVS